MTAKEFALQAIAPYYADPTTCGYNSDTSSCVYLTEDGRKCVFGKYMLPEILEKCKDSKEFSTIILSKYEGQSKVLIPEAVDILTDNQWRILQRIHDAIADDSINEYPEIFRDAVVSLNLFTEDELKEFASNLQTNKN